MNPPSSSSVPEPPDSGPAGEAPGVRSTAGPKPSGLPPASAPRSVSALALDWLAESSPVGRRSGPRAELAFLRSQLAIADREGDADLEQRVAAVLARRLAAQGVELDVATKLARRALLLGEDQRLREELSTWFAGLGEAGLAAATLRPLVESESGENLARVLIRIAVLLGRTGDASGASEALARAAQSHASDPIAPELRGAIAAWAPARVSPYEAAQMYLEGARRRESNGDRAGAFEDVLRAFEMAPESAIATERLASSLASRGRLNAADEVRREHGRALGDRGRAAHEGRIGDAILEGDVFRALGAAYDARWDQNLDLEASIAAVDLATRSATKTPDDFDSLLVRANLFEMLAARLELAVDEVDGPPRARGLLALGRLCAGPIANAERAVDAWVEALESDPSSEPVKAVLREYAASTGDYGPLIEGLVRVGTTEDEELEADRVACLGELAILAEQRLGDAALALWAVQRAPSDDSKDTGLLSSEARLRPRAKLQDDSLASAREALSRATGRGRLEPLRLAAAALKGRPGSVDELISVLFELVRIAPEERGWRALLERALVRCGRLDELARLFDEDVSARGGAARAERNRLGIAWIHRRAGRPKDALSALEPMLDDSSTGRRALGMLLALSTQLGRADVRARSLLKLGELLPSAANAVFASIAAEGFLDANDATAARRAAEHACRADASLARPLCTFARVAAESRDRVAALAFERAVGAVVPRGHLCDALAQTFDALDEPELALAWTQRWLALRPADSAAISALLRRVTASGDGQRLGDALAWLLSQPRPLGQFAPLLCEAVTRLAALDPQRGTAIARRALDVFGPRALELTQALLAVADSLDERFFAIAVIERQLASGSLDGSRAEVLVDLARRRRHAGDADGAARTLVRALAEGADPDLALGELDVALAPRTSDGEVSLAEARAEALSASSTADLAGTSRAWREYGAVLWDLAEDPEAAILAWERAAALDPNRGLERLARDLAAFSGHAGAVRRLEGLALRKTDPAEAARVLARAAGVALDGGLPAEALDLALRSLEKDPSGADVLAIAERAAGSDDLDRLEHAYELVAAGVLGVYGERAARYRAARQFERRGERHRALRHAVAAFEAVPAEGVTFVVMMRLAERTGQSEDVVRAIERVTEREHNPESRSTWLRRAALIAGDSEDGKRQRVDVLLRALDTNPEGETLRSLGRALSDVIGTAPEERDILLLRYDRALSRMLPRLGGPDGARIAIEAAEFALDAFGTASLAFRTLERATELDASIDEYEALMPRLESLASEPEKARALIDRVQELLDAQYSNLGAALRELAISLAEALPDVMRAARLLVTFAKKHLEDETAFARAEMAALQAADEGLIRELAAAVPPEQRAEKLFDSARAAIEGGRIDEAVRALEEARRMGDVEQATRDRAEEDLRNLYRRAGRSAALEELLRQRLSRDDLSAEARTDSLRELASLCVQLGRGEDARRVLTQGLTDYPASRALLDDALRLARQLEDAPWQIDLLSRLVDRQADPAARVQALRKLAALLDEQGDADEGLRRWSEVRQLDPEDVSAVTALERDAERRGDWERLVELLAVRSGMARTADEARLTELQRAETLESRLGRADEARGVLEALLEGSGDQLDVLTRLADLNERLGAKLRAAPLWLRASAIPKDRAAAGDFARRACEAYLEGGDVDSATRVLAELASYPHTPELLELRVDVARRNEDPRSLAEALEEKALSSMEPPVARAALLVEAARAALLAEDLALALGQATRASRIAPESAEPQLFARLLEYRYRRAGTQAQAHTTIAELNKIEEPLTSAQGELKAFLMAEAYDVVGPAGEGLRRLSQAHAELGARPLIAIGMAERLASSDEPERALPLFDAALEGDLRSLRKRGEVALAAAHAAELSGDPDRALLYLDVAASLPETRAKALEAQAALRAVLARVSDPPPFSDEDVLGDLEIGRPSRRTTLGIVDVPGPGTHQLTSTARVGPPATTAASPSNPAPPLARPRPSSATVPVSEAPSSPRRRSEPPPDDTLSKTADSVRSSFPPPFPPASDEENALLKALSHGSIQAGKDLMRRLEGRSERTHDLVNVCRRVALLLPGDWWVLGKLYEATLADRNVIYARAIEHVLHAFDPNATPVDPPDLEDQIEQPERVQAMLFRDTAGPATEALGLVWNSAQHIFRRDPASYGVTGLERVNPTAPTPLAHLYASAGRLLGLTRTPLFQRRSGEPVTVNVALLSPPALIVSGEVRAQTPDLAYHIGAMLAATLPECVLLYGAPESQVQDVLRALVAAFGPPQAERGRLASIATLAEMLWESIPARSQRRLSELCDDPGPIEYHVALASARQAVRRAGLFVSGDLTIGVRESCADLGISTRGLGAPGGLAALCAASPAVADLVRLATSPQYADARWRPKRGSGQHRSPVWTTV